MIASFLIASLVVIGIYIGSHKLSGLQTGIVILSGIIGLIFVIFPAVASSVGRMIGVGRGADLILYCSVVAGLFVSSNLYFRLKRQEQQIIELTRALALSTSKDKPKDH